MKHLTQVRRMSDLLIWDETAPDTIVWDETATDILIWDVFVVAGFGTEICFTVIVTPNLEYCGIL